jgi:hypothetical protein
MIPMRFEPMIYPSSSDGERTEDPETGEPFEGNDIGWIDPRALDEEGNLLSPREMAQYEGELAWPERFDSKFDRDQAYEIGEYGYAGQYQQSPVPRKGGIIKREYWQDYLIPKSGKFPDMEFVCVSVDTAFTEKEENDPTGCTTWRLNARRSWGVVPINPKTDKYARAVSVQPTFSQGLVYAPNRDWVTPGTSVRAFGAFT